MGWGRSGGLEFLGEGFKVSRLIDPDGRPGLRVGIDAAETNQSYLAMDGWISTLPTYYLLPN